MRRYAPSRWRAETLRSERIQFSSLQEFDSEGDADLVYCNGVFHHIPPQERSSALKFVDRTLRTGGLFSFWENNPWNPGTQYLMSRLPFDRDAIKLSSIESRRLVRIRTVRRLAHRLRFLLSTLPQVPQAHREIHFGPTFRRPIPDPLSKTYAIVHREFD